MAKKATKVKVNVGEGEGKSEILFIDGPKYKRAKEIIALLDRNPKNEHEVELKAKFTVFIKEDAVEDKDLLEYVYTKLGGLIRTHEEQEEVDEKVAEFKNKGKKDDDEENND